MDKSPLAGTLIEGKYEILSKIREGGMGSIYRVRHRLLDEVRVVKVMLPQLGSEEEYKQRFAQEAKMATRLKHINVATIHDFALDPDGTAYIVMEFIEGMNLAELLKATGPCDIPLSLEIAHQALSALGYLHRKNIVHRDIALDNLMLTRDEEEQAHVKLIDLGISKPLDKTIELTSRGVFLGKLKYSSPEQLGALPVGESLDGRSDLYSLGVVLYEMTTGKPPFAGDTPRELIGGHLFQPPSPFEETDPQGRVPPGLRAVILKALEKKREARFATAEEFDREILLLMETGGKAVIPDATRKLFTRGRATREVVSLAPVTPSAQDRLDRQFLAQTTTPPRTVGALDAKTGDPTVAYSSVPMAVPPPPPAVAPSAPHPAKRSWVPVLAVSAVAILVAGLILLRSRGRDTGSDAPPTPVAPTALAVEPPIEASPIAEIPTALAEVDPSREPAPTAAPDLSRLRAFAEQARSRATAARQAAERAGAPLRSEEVFSSARGREREGQRLLTRGEFEGSVAAYQDAADLFRQAARTAAAPQPTPVEIAELRIEPTPVPEPTRPILLPTAVPEPTRPPTPRVSASQTEELKVRETINRYIQAQNTLDVDLYALVYPALAGERRQAVESAFRNLRSQQLEGEIRQVRISGSTAEVRLFESRVAVPRAGSEQRDSRERTIHLAKRGDAWVITSLN